MILDWEKGDWNSSRGTAKRPPWSGRFGKARKRARGVTAGLVKQLAAASPGKQVGLAPQFIGKWDYGLMARTLDGQARRLGRARNALQSVQTQDHCAYRGGRGMKAVACRSPAPPWGCRSPSATRRT